MATINLGRVKGDPFRYEDFTPEQLAGLKGESFKFEDFTPEELESISAKVEVGTVTTLDAGEQATVTTKVEGNVTKLNFGIPQGEDAPTFTGTAAEYEAIADTIEDGTLINITDDFVEGETLDTYVLNKVDELEGKLDSSVKTKEELMANDEEGKLADALAIKDAINTYNVAKNTGKQYSTLEEFVEDTANNINVPSVGRLKDITGFVMGTPNWYRYMIVYQNTYQQGNSSSVSGNGIFWNDQKRMWNVFIYGNKDSGLTATYKEIGTPTIKTQADLMANTVSGLFPDALAVKDAVNYINVAQKNQANFATLEEFVSATCLNNGEIPHIFRFKDTGGWGPLGGSYWYRCMVQYQNWYLAGNVYPVRGQGILWADDGTTYIMDISGNKDTGLSVKYSIIGSISTREEIINANQLSYSFNDAASNGGLSANDITFLSMHIYHYNGHCHGINLGLQFNKKIPAGSKITITVSGTTIDYTLTPNWNNVQWGNMAMLRENNQILLIATKEISSGYGWWSYIPFNTFYAYNK